MNEYTKYIIRDLNPENLQYARFNFYSILSGTEVKIRGKPTKTRGYQSSFNGQLVDVKNDMQQFYKDFSFAFKMPSENDLMNELCLIIEFYNNFSEFTEYGNTKETAEEVKQQRPATFQYLLSQLEKIEIMQDLQPVNQLTKGMKIL